MFILNKTFLSTVLLNNIYMKHPHHVLFHVVLTGVCLESYFRLGIGPLCFKDVQMVSVLKGPKAVFCGSD